LLEKEELSITKELAYIETQYQKYLKMIVNLNKDLDDLLLSYNEKKFVKV
jgi:hypothetical protein